ncbi:MAG: DUF1569 domain-containing protein [Planctomycetales bacterium]|nr:DUF1569 domain-containing protein [Planctomycetales bacterium]
MSINTKTVEGRRKLRFDTLDELLAEADRLAAGDVKMLGNWSLAQIFAHLAAGINSTIDGSTFKPPIFVRLMAPLMKGFMKKKFIHEGIPAGFQIPKDAQAQFVPADDVELQKALGELHTAIERFKSQEQLADHPLLGQLTKEETMQFQLRHAEMHLSFAIPLA